MTLQELKKHISTKNKKELIAELIELYKKFKDVKNHYTSQLSTKGRGEVVKKYKKMISNEMFSQIEDYGIIDLSGAIKVLEKFLNVSESPHDRVDITLYYIEQGVELANNYGELYEEFYENIEEVYEEALKLITSNELQNDFRERCREIVLNAPHGWGFYDQLSDLFDEYLSTI